MTKHVDNRSRREAYQFPQLLVRGASLAALTSVGQDIVQALFARAHVHAFPVSSRSRSATLRAASILRLCLVISPRSAAAWRLRRLATACSARCRSGLQPNISSEIGRASCRERVWHYV